MDLATQLMLEAFGGGPNEWPYTPEEWEARARESIPAPNFDYIAGGAGSEETLRANRRMPRREGGGGQELSGRGFDQRGLVRRRW